MKALLLSTYDIEGGAARAAYRLHQGLQQQGIDSQMLVQTQSSDDPTVHAPRTRSARAIAQLRPTLDALPLQFYRQRDRVPFSLQWLPDRLPASIAKRFPDLINLHWSGRGFLRLETLTAFKQPLVWTLHDMWAFTGGCHYNQACDRYLKTCGACPQLQSHREWDLSRWVWQRKAKTFHQLDLTLVTPSHWLAQAASSSPLLQSFRVEVIPNGLDLQRFKPCDRQTARTWLNLPQDKQLLLFGAMDATSDPRKGFSELHQALQQLNQTTWREKLALVIFGASQASDSLDLGFETHYLGKLKDEISLALVYAAADVFVAPSRQDNLPNTVLEAIACGTPCVAFNLGGMPDLISHQQTGYLAQSCDTADLAQGIAWVLESCDRQQKLGNQARQQAERQFSLDRQAKRYSTLFQEILHRRDRAIHP